MQRRDFLKVALGTGAAAAFTPAILPAKLTFKKDQVTRLKIGNERKTFRAYSDEYQRYLDELNENWEKWKKVFGRGNLARFGDHIKEVAMLSENLRRWNEKLGDDPLASQWKRISIPISWRSQMDSVSRELFGYQVMTQPSQLVFCSSVDKDNWKGQVRVDQWTSELDKTGWDICGYTLRTGGSAGHFGIYGRPIAAMTRKMKCCMWSPEAVSDLKYVNNLDAEAELAAIVSMEFALEQDREHITNVNKNCSTVYNYPIGVPWEQPRLSTFLEWAITEERKKFLDRGALYSDHERFEWIVTSSEVIAKLEKENALTPNEPSYWRSSLGIHLVGWLRNSSARVRIYQDPLFPSKEILIGRKYSDIDTGYIAIPYLYYIQTPGIQTPAILDRDSFCPKNPFLARYNRILTNPNFYAKMIVYI